MQVIFILYLIVKLNEKYFYCVLTYVQKYKNLENLAEYGKNKILLRY